MNTSAMYFSSYKYLLVVGIIFFIMDVIQIEGIKSAKNLNSEKLKYLVLEAFEVAFIKCNHENINYNVLTILEMVKNIIPTAFVLGSSYWAFYKRGTEKQFCICPYYGLKCKHVKVSDDWLEIPHVSGDTNTLIDRSKGFISLPMNFVLESQTEKMPKFCSILIKTSLHLYRLENSEYKFSRATPMYEFGIKFRITPLKAPYDLSITLLEPNPRLLQYYGKIFQVLKEKNIYTCRDGYVKWTLAQFGISHEHLPVFTLVPLKNFISPKLYVKECNTILNYCSYCLE